MTSTAKILIGIGAGSLALALLYQARKNDPAIRSMEKVPFNQNAMTIPPFGIFIDKKEINNQALINHELVHWGQYQRMGLLPFYFNYVMNNVTFGYDRNPMEIEARQNESPWCIENYTECVRNGMSTTVINPTFRMAL